MSGRPTVILDPHFRRMDEIFSHADRVRLHGIAEVIWGRDEPMPPEAFQAALPEATVVICGDWRYGNLPPVAAPLRAIIEVSGGFPRQLDYATCFTRGIRVLSCAPAFGPQVAEMALAMALDAMRGIAEGDRAMRAGTELYAHAGNVGNFSLRGKAVGFIGYGNLAHHLRPLLAPFGCPISAYDPWLGEGYLRGLDVKPVGLEALLETSRVTFVLAVPSSENRALLSRELLARIPADAVLVLMSRAHVVDFDALTEFLLAGRFRAAIDVFPIEPLPADHPIRGAAAAVLSAHRAGPLREEMWEIGRMVVDDLEMIVRGLPPLRLQVAQPELVARYVRNRAQRGTPPAPLSQSQSVL